MCDLNMKIRIKNQEGKEINPDYLFNNTILLNSVTKVFNIAKKEKNSISTIIKTDKATYFKCDVFVNE